MYILVDENVSVGVIKELRQTDHVVFSISLDYEKGILDEDVWSIAIEKNALLITRDFHFTNSIRFNPEDICGILYIRHGNLTSEEEIKLIIQFLQSYSSDIYRGKLITLSPHEVKVR